MGKIQVWQCEHDGQLFKEKVDYINHLRTIARARLDRKNFKRDTNARIAAFVEMRKTCRSAAQIRKFIGDHWLAFCINGNHLPSSPKIHPELNYFRFVKFEWSDQVSNSHSCPHNGVMNWGRDPNKPTSYEGWVARIEYQPNRSPDGTYDYGVNIWAGTGIHTHGGGFAGNQYYYDIRLFADDWPAMAETVNTAKIYMEITANTHLSFETVCEMFDTDDKVRGFRAQYPHLQERYFKAKTWKALNNDRRPLREVIEDFNE